jgi:DNA-binding NarL/FixJ family response regulator
MLSSVQGASKGPLASRARAERRARGGADSGTGSDVRTAVRSDTLSSRELGVLEELAKGTSTEDIAGKFHVSPHTVRTHIKNILRKLDAHTRAHAVAIAYSEDAIDPDVTA